MIANVTFREAFKKILDSMPEDLFDKEFQKAVESHRELAKERGCLVAFNKMYPPKPPKD
jgi:hypothetical protein